jgi:hypothetical protein
VALFHCCQGFAHLGSAVALKPRYSGGEGHGGRPRGMHYEVMRLWLSRLAKELSNV